MTEDPFSLDRLAPVTELDPVGWYPFAPGVWFLIALAVWWAANGLVTWAARYHANAYRRKALRLMKSLENPATLQDGLRRTNEVLKRTALVAFPRQRVASLWGTEWVQFLQRHAHRIPIQGTAAESLAWVSVRSLPESFDHRDYLVTLRTAQAWVRTHQVELD